MKVSTPTISWHNRERVSSVDFQPVAHPRPTANGANSGFGCRLASAGDDKHVVIWELVVDETGKVEPSCLCDLNRHQNSVNVVRWSPNGKMLASGDTDSTIYIWQYEEKEESSSAPDIFSDDAECIRRENWTVLKCLRGHLQDVVGIAWSPGSESNYLFSCSTDGTAIVFDVRKATKLKILSDHNGWVNGVAWDPLNKHVMTIASDRCLRLFGTKSYNYVRKINKCKLPVGSSSSSDVDNAAGKSAGNSNSSSEKNVRLFHDDTFQSFYRRMDFSPDGELLAIPSGVMEFDVSSAGSSDPVTSSGKTNHCTHIFSRTNYCKPVLSLPGKDFSTCVRFSPVKYTLRPVPRVTPIVKEVANEQEDHQPPVATAAPQPSPEVQPLWEKYETLVALPYRMVYSIVTQNAVTFYDTQQAEPFAQVSKIHYLGLNDVTWSPDGQSLIVASSDGFCSLINFRNGEIGTIYDENTCVAPTSTVQQCGSPEVVEIRPQCVVNSSDVTKEDAPSPCDVIMEDLTISGDVTKEDKVSSGDVTKPNANSSTNDVIKAGISGSSDVIKAGIAGSDDVTKKGVNANELSCVKTATPKRKVQLITLSSPKTSNKPSSSDVINKSTSDVTSSKQVTNDLIVGSGASSAPPPLAPSAKRRVQLTTIDVATTKSPATAAGSSAPAGTQRVGTTNREENQGPTSSRTSDGSQKDKPSTVSDVIAAASNVSDVSGKESATTATPPPQQQQPQQQPQQQQQQQPKKRAQLITLK